MRGLLALMLLWPCIAAAETVAPNPAAWIPDDAKAWVLLHDGERSRARWATSPYATLMTTAWAASLSESLSAKLSERDIDAKSLLPIFSHTRQCAFACSLIDDDLVLTLAGDSNLDAWRSLLINADAIATRLDGRQLWLSDDCEMLALESGWLWRKTPLAQPLTIAPRSTTLAITAPESDLECILEPGIIAALETLLDEPLNMDSDEGQFISLTLAEIGLHERQIQRSGTASAALIRAAALDPIPHQRLLDLPGDTLWAVASRLDSSLLLDALMQEDGMDDFDRAQIDAGLVELGIPALSDCLPLLGNEIVLWCRAGAPWPIFEADLSCDRELADAIIAACRTHLNLSDVGDAGVEGVVGMVSLRLAWKDGHLRVSTDPFGLDQQQAGRFGDHAMVQAAVAHWHDDAFVIAASRSRESWLAIGGLAQLGLLGLGQTNFGTLAGDLAKAGRYGYCSARRDGGDIIVDAGGLFGGPIGWVCAGLAFALYF